MPFLLLLLIFFRLGCARWRVWDRIIVLLCVGVMNVVGSRAAEPSAQVLDIPVFAGGFGIAFYEETARLFEKERPGVVVRLYGDPRIADKIRVRVMDGNLPDAAQSGQVLWPALIRAGKVLDLGPFLDEPNWEGDARWGDTFVAGALEAWRVEDGVYGVPFGYALWTIFYDQGLFRRHGWSEPQTWDEFFALCERIEAAGLAPLALPGTRGLYPEAFFRAAYYNLAGADGWRSLNALSPGARMDPRHARAADILQRVTQHHTFRGWEGATHTGAQLAFLEGRAAMTVSGSWFINEMKNRLPADFELGTMNFPVFPDGVADPSAIQTGSDSFFVFDTGDDGRTRLTVDFLRFLTSRARAEAFVRRVDAPVAVRGVPPEAYSELSRPAARLIERAVESFNMPQDMLQPAGIRQAMTDARFRLMTGELTAEAFGGRLEAAAESDRARTAAPETVEVRHPGRAAVLLGTLLVTGVWLGWRFRARTVDRREKSDTYGQPRLTTGVSLGFVGPAFAVYGAFVLLPGLVALGWAFTFWDGLGDRRWAGLLHFKRLLLESDVFWTALGNNVFLMLVPAFVVVPVALGCAALLHRGVAGAAFFRVVLLFPNLLGGIAAALLWLNVYEPHGGLANAALAGLGRVMGSAWLAGFEGFPWLSPDHLYPALLPVYLWMACGFNLVLYLAAMQGVPDELYEAAEIEGASRLRQFFTITLPLIWEVIVISAVFLVIGGLNAFEMVWLLAQQDPVTGVHTLSTLMVSTMFKEFDVGRATAIAVILFVLVLVGSAAVMRGLRREVVER